MNQEDAVRRTIKHAQWCKKNPNRLRTEYYFGCYVCEVFRCCSTCPLGTRTLHCIDSNISPYHLFEIGNPQSARVKQPDRVIGACRRWLKKHGKSQ